LVEEIRREKIESGSDRAKREKKTQKGVTGKGRWVSQFVRSTQEGGPKVIKPREKNEEVPKRKKK